MSGKNTDWDLERIKEEILERMNHYKAPEDEYLDMDLIEDFEQLIKEEDK